MFCRNCGNNLEEGTKFCNKCGASQDRNTIITNNIGNTDDTLLQEFIGPQYYSITKTKFHVFTFLFGPYYLLYRKMYKVSLLWLLGALALSLFISDLSYVYSVVMCVVMSLNFKKIYPNHAKKKIEEIKRQNPNASIDVLINLCREKGGVSVGAVFAGLGIYYVAVFGISFIIGFLSAII